MTARVSSHYVWAFVERLAPMLVSFAAGIAIARVVAPEAYGLLAMLGIFLALGQGLTELGFSAGLIQRRVISEDESTTVFYVNIAAGLIITLLLCAVSPLIATFFGQPLLTFLLPAQAVGILLGSFSIVHIALLSREHSFRKIAEIELGATVVSSAAGVLAAYGGAGVWSLVVLGLVREMVRSVLAWSLGAWRPAGSISLAIVADMWAYSGKLLYASMFHRVASNVHAVLIGKILSPESLGLFARAQSLQILPINLVTGMTQRVAFPTFSRLQDDHPALLLSVRALLIILACILSYLMGILGMVSRDLLPWLLGPSWTQAGPLLEIVAMAGVFAGVFPVLSQTTMALGNSREFLRAEVLKKTAIFLIVPCAIPFGLTGFAYSLVAVSISDYVLSARPVRTALGYSWRQQCGDLLPWPLVGLAAAIAVRLAAPLPEVAPLARITLQVILFTLLYVVILAPWGWQMVRDSVRRVLRAKQ